MDPVEKTVDALLEKNVNEASRDLYLDFVSGILSSIDFEKVLDNYDSEEISDEDFSQIELLNSELSRLFTDDDFVRDIASYVLNLARRQLPETLGL